MIDFAALAQTVTALLAPFLPQLLKVGEDFGEEVIKDTVEDGWNEAKALWAKLHPSLASKPAALDAVHDAAENPDDADAIASLRLQIRKLLTADPALAEAVSGIVDQRVSAGTITARASGHRSVAVGGGVQSGVIVTGDSNAVGTPTPDRKPNA